MYFLLHSYECNAIVFFKLLDDVPAISAYGITGTGMTFSDYRLSKAFGLDWASLGPAN